MAMKQRVKVTRALRVSGEDVGVGSIIDLDGPTAAELRLGNKVEFAQADSKIVVFPVAKKEKPAASEQSAIAALTAQVSALTALVGKLVEGKSKETK